MLFVLVAPRIGAADPLGLTEPEIVPARAISEDGDGPTYYRLRSNTVSYLSRSALGGATRLGDGTTSFTLDLQMGSVVRFGREATTGLWFEGGYSYVHGHEHLAVLGVGPMYRPNALFGKSLALVPHAVLGHVDGRLGAGVRTSVVLGVGPIAFELAHQVVVTDREHVHEVRMLLTFPFDAGATL